MLEDEYLAERFEAQRPRLKAVAYRMLGTFAEAEDAVQEAWLKLARSDAAAIDNLDAWLTTVVSRVCLDMLRARRLRNEDPLDAHLPDPVVSSEEAAGPEERAVLADSVGLALLVVLESLTPAERLAFVLHDLFGVGFEEIAPIVDRTPIAARKLASRARQVVRGAAPRPDPDRGAQRRVVDAFLTAARGGDVEGLLAILDPDVVVRMDGSAGAMQILRGATAVSGRAEVFQRVALRATAYPALVNGHAGLVSTMDGELLSIMSFTVAGGRIVTMDILSDRDRLDQLDLSAVPQLGALRSGRPGPDRGDRTGRVSAGRRDRSTRPRWSGGTGRE
jgi:RNA polymerase sigma factor (sigma-70 family)